MNGAWRTISVALHAESGQYLGSLSKASAATKAFGDDTDRSTKKASTSWTTFSKVAKVGLAAAGLALTVFIGASIKAAAEFEQKMSAVKAVAGATGDEFDLLREKALQIGADTSFSASQAATAMEELVKAGVNVTGVLNGAADATVALAAAGDVDLARAAEIAANSMNQFGLTAEELPRITDLITGSANRSAIGVEDFGMSLSQAGAVAKLTGLGFTDTAVAITAMGNAGIKGSDAGTSLKTFLMRLVPSTTEAANEMERLGIITADGANRFFDAEGNLKSFSYVAGILQESLAGLTREQQLATLNTMFGSDAIRAAAVVADEGAVGWLKLAESIGQVSAQDVADERLNNLSGSIEKFKGSVETMMISSGSLFTAVLKPVVDGATDLVNTLSQDPTEFFGAIARGLTPLAPAWASLVDAGENLVEILDTGGQVALPFARGLASVAATATITGFKTLADVLEAITGTLAENEAATKAVTYAVLGLAGLAAWKAIVSAVETIYIKWLYLEGTVTGTALVAGLRTIGAGFITMGTDAQLGASMVKSGMAGAAAAVAPLLVATAAVAGFAAAWQGLEKARSKASEQAESLKPPGFNPRDLQDLNDYANALSDAYFVSSMEDGNNGLTWEEALRGSGELLSPAENSILDAGIATKELSSRADAAAKQMRALKVVLADTFTEIYGREPFDLGINSEELDHIARWAEKLDIDPAAIGAEEFASQIKDAANAARNGTVQTDELAGAYAVLADETSNATDRLAAWRDAVGAALGIPMDIFDADTGLASKLRELTMELAINGSSLTDNTEDATANRDALSSAAQSVIDVAAAYGAGEGGIAAANLKLAEGREKLLDAGEAAGISREQMGEYLDTLGLTPEFVESQIKLQNVEGAKTAAKELKTSLEGLRGTWKSTVQVDTEKAMISVLLLADAINSLTGNAATTGTAGMAIVTSGHGGPVPGSDEWWAAHGGRPEGSRWGNVYAYARGGFGAGVYAGGPLHKFAEPETGGEAYLPRFGDMARNERLLSFVASNWYGGRFVPKGQMVQPQPRPGLNAAYQGLDAAAVAAIAGAVGGRSVTVNARTNASPRAIGHQVDRALAFGSRIPT